MLDNITNSNNSRIAPTGYPVPSVKIDNKIYFKPEKALNALEQGGFSLPQIKIAENYSNGFRW